MSKTMAEVLAENMDQVFTAEYGDALAFTGDAEELAELLSAAGFGLVADAKAEALEEAADKIMGPSDVVLDGATCRWNAMALRETATNLRNPS